MSLTVRQLEVLRALAAELHFARAAERTGLSQPTVSKELARLERALGLELFRRSSGGTTLTAEGAALRAPAERVLDALDELDRTAALLRRRRSHEVHVAASPSVVNRLMPLLLRRLERTDPQLEVTVVEVETGRVSAALDDGTADLGIGHHVDAPIHGQVKTIGADEVFTIAASSVLADDDEAVDLGRLADVPLLLWPREQSPAYHDALLEICRSRGLDPMLLTGTSRLGGSRSYLLREGRAFALGPRDFAVSEGLGVRAAPLQPSAFVPLDLAWTEPLLPAAELVVTQVAAIASRAAVAG